MRWKAGLVIVALFLIPRAVCPHRQQAESTSARITTAAFSPDGRLIRVLLERRIDTSSRRAPAAPSFAEAVWVAGFSTDDKVLACGAGNNSVVVWETATWKYRVLRAVF